MSIVMPVDRFREMAQTPELTWTKKDLDGLSRIAQIYNESKVRHFVFPLLNVPQKLVNLRVQKILFSRLLPQDMKVYSIVTLSSWAKGKEKYEVFRKDVLESSLEHSLTSSGVDAKACEPLHWRLGQLLIDSSTFPEIFPYHDPSNRVIVAELHVYIQNSLRYLPEVKKGEWRHQNLNLMHKSAIEFAMRELDAEGFDVDLLPPHFEVEKKDDGTPSNLRCHQSLRVRIREGAAVDANTSDKIDGFSLQDELIAWQTSERKLSPPPTLSVPDALKQISEELTFVAKKGSLERRYAFNIIEMGSPEQLKLKSELESLGYTVTLDSPFIHKMALFGSIPLHRIGDFWEQHLYIDLPS